MSGDTDRAVEARGGCDRCGPCRDFGCNGHEDVTGRTSSHPVTTNQPDPQPEAGHWTKPFTSAEIVRLRLAWASHPEEFSYDAGRWLLTLDAASSRPAAPDSPDQLREAAQKPPVKWATIREDATERGLFSVVDEAMIGRKLTPTRRKLIVGNIVMAVAKWRETFRDCGCWKIADGYALCPWHERMLQSQVDPLRAALSVSPRSDTALDVTRCRDLDYDAHDWNSNGSPSFCRDCGIIFPRYAALSRTADQEPG